MKKSSFLLLILVISIFSYNFDFSQFKLLIQQKNFDEALNLIYSQDLPTDKQNKLLSYLYNSWGLYLLNQKKISQAIEKLQEAISYNSNDTIYYNLANAYYLANDFDNALYSVNSIDNQNFQVLKLKAYILYRMGNFQGAIEILEQLKSNGNFDYNLKQLLANCYARAGMVEQAAEISSKYKRQSQVEKDYSTDIYGHFSVKYKFDTNTLKNKEFVFNCLNNSWDELSNIIQSYPDNLIPVVIYASNDFKKAGKGIIPDWAGGVFDGRIKIPSYYFTTNMLDELRKTLRHELMHALIWYKVGNKIPLWFNEGIAQFAEPHTLKYKNLGLKMLEKYPIEAISSGFRGNYTTVKASYAASFMVVNYLVKKWGQWILASILDKLNQGFSLKQAIEEETGVDFSTLRKNVIEFYKSR